MDKYSSHSACGHPHIKEVTQHVLNALGDTYEGYVQADCEKMVLASNSDGLQLEDTHTESAHFDLGAWRLDELL